jgi:dipeptidyl aminopeptidase/acylaminoacyl peptidase
MMCRLGSGCVGVVLLIAMVGLLPPAAPGQAGSDKKAGWTPATVLKILTVQHVQPSPDGKRVVYTVTQTHVDGGTPFSMETFVANGDGSKPLSIGKKGGWVDQPQWSPDGQWIAYLAGELYRARPDGSEEERLTPAGCHLTSFHWSPDGKQIAFTYFDRAAHDKPQAGLDIVFREPTQNEQLGAVATTQDATGHFVVRKLTSADYHVSRLQGSYSWSPDSKQIAFSRVKSSRIDDWTTADIWLVNVDTGELRPLAATAAAEMNPLFSPDGQYVACTITDLPLSWTPAVRIQLVPVKGGPAKLLAPTFNERPTPVSWSEDGCKIYYLEQHHTAVQLFALPLNGTPVALSPADAVIGHVHANAKRNMVGFTLEKLQSPAEGFVSKLDTFDPVTITKVNEELRQLPLPKTDLLQWKGPDGLEIEGLLTYPTPYVAGKRYPMLLEIHGGPANLYLQDFVANPTPYTVAMFADRGFVVLRCNPRGSTGYGILFRRANHKDWGGKDFQDLMLGVDHVIGMGVADEKKLGVMGWSYGGYMAAWTITHTKRFKAASIGAGITNLVSFAGTTDMAGFLPSYLGGEFWDHPGRYEKHSPISHVKNVTTPTLLQHGRHDERVPLSQSVELYRALKRQGTVTQLHVYPQSGHTLVGQELLDGMQRNLAWMEKHVK